MARFYRLLLDDYSAASFTSFDKDYFGTLEDIDGLFKAIREDEDTAERFQDILSVYDQYLSGNTKVTHNVAYRDVPFLVPAKVLGAETSVLTNYSWEHVNTWGCIYKMKCDKAERDTSGFPATEATHDASRPGLRTCSTKVQPEAM